MHISASCDPCGGIATYIRQIADSSLATEFEFIQVFYPRSRWSHPGALCTLARAIRNAAPQLVHVHGLQLEGVVGVLAARLAGCRKVVVTIHGFMEDSLARSKWRRVLVARAIEPWALRLSLAFYCVSSYGTTKAVVRQYRRKCFGVINNSLPLAGESVRTKLAQRQLAGLTPSICSVLFVGRITRDKGVFDLLPLLSLARRQSGVDIRVTLVGDGPDLAAFRASVSVSGMDPIISIEGYQRDTAPYYLAADVFVLPSYHEHQSYAILEAMRAGVPVLAYDVGGNGELVEAGVTGCLSHVGNVEEMARHLSELAADSSRRTALGEAGRHRLVAEFGFQRFLDAVAGVYARLLGKR
jgi:glycosyltransferase involved in cell wall biosynthesis